MDKFTRRLGGTVLGAVLATTCAFGQGFAMPNVSVVEPAPVLTEEQARTLLAGDLSPEQRERARLWNKARVEQEKRMKTIRFKHFGGKATPEVRQAGIAQLREITEPAAFPSMLEIYRDEQSDVLKAVCEHLADLSTDQSLTTLAHAAVYERRAEFRALASAALKEEIDTGRPVPPGVHTIVASGLDTGTLANMGDAARLAQTLKLIEAIPAMIASQISAAGGGGSAGGYIAYIVVGTQRAYVADLEPVVGNGSVAFDPIPGVITEGTVLAINDAVVVQYSMSVHDALVGLTSDLSGENTAHLGWNPHKWNAWYANVLLPHLAKEREAQRQRESGKPAKETQAKPRKRNRGPIAV